MKKKFLLLLFAVMLSHSSFFAQGNSKFTKDYIPLSPEQSFQDKRIRNSNATDFIIGNEYFTASCIIHFYTNHTRICNWDT